MVAEGGEGENPLPFSLTAPNVGGVGEGGGVGGVSRLRFPPGPHLQSSRFSRHPRLRQAPARRFAKNRNLRVFGGRWMVSEGGALQSHERRVPVFAPAFQPQGAGDLAEPCIPAA